MLILASASPRRQQLLTQSGIKFIVSVANIEEIPQKNEGGHAYVKRNAKEKALAVCKRFQNQIILSADTIVVSQADEILEKPRDAAHAEEMLTALSGGTHLVLTGYSLYHGEEELITRLVETSVTFRSLSNREIKAYIQTGEPFDKAGSYGIQGKAMGFVESIQGSYTNVMGLPLSHVVQDLEALAGIKTFSNE